MTMWKKLLFLKHILVFLHFPIFILSRFLLLLFCFTFPLFLFQLKPLLSVDGGLGLPVPQEVCRERCVLAVAVKCEHLISGLQRFGSRNTLERQRVFLTA